jgi:membrane-associated phospholipid phosphatase
MFKHIFGDFFSDNKFFFIGFFLWVIGLAILQLMFTQTELIFWVNRHYSDGLDLFFKYVTKLGEDYWYLLVIGYLIINHWRRVKVPKGSKWNYSQFFFSEFLLKTFIIAWIFKALLSTALKYFIDAQRPMGVYADKGLDIHLVRGVNIHTAHSFPSGHTMTAFALACFLALIVKNKAWGIFFLILAILVAYSRVYLFLHFPKDVFAGSIFGVFVVFVAFQVLKINLIKP